jgi:hypothetical protein
MNTMTTQNKNENLTVHFKVKDYAAWRTGYNTREKGRLSAGITNGRVFRSADDANDIVILQDVADVSKARTWLTSDDTKAAMQASGVIGSPSIRFSNYAVAVTDRSRDGSWRDCFCRVAVPKIVRSPGVFRPRDAMAGAFHSPHLLPFRTRSSGHLHGRSVAAIPNLETDLT